MRSGSEATGLPSSILFSTPCRYMHVQKIEEKRQPGSGDEEPSINQSPYLNMAEDGLLAAVSYEKDANTPSEESRPKPEDDIRKRSFKELCRQTKKSIWWVGYVGVVTGFPLLGLLLNYLFRNRKKHLEEARRFFTCVLIFKLFDTLIIQPCTFLFPYTYRWLKRA